MSHGEFETSHPLIGLCLWTQLASNEAKEMEWISVKDRLPENDDPVLIVLNTKDQLPLVARFVRQVSGFMGEFKNTWFVFVPPRFPKPWMFSEEYIKAFRLKKEKVSHWMPIPVAPSRKK
jgi:hypothetical protein